MNKNKGWEEEEINYVIENFGKLETREMAETLNRTNAAINSRVRVLREKGILKQPEKIWTKADEEYLITNYGVIKPYIIARKLGKSTQQVYSKISSMERNGQLGMTEAYKRTMLEKEERRKQQKEKRDNQYSQMMEEDKKTRNYGIGKKQLDIELSKDKTYQIKINEGRKRTRTFKGKLVQATHNHITFISNSKIRESFLRNDILRNQIKIKEVRN